MGKKSLGCTMWLGLDGVDALNLFLEDALSDLQEIHSGEVIQIEEKG